LISLALLD